MRYRRLPLPAVGLLALLLFSSAAQTAPPRGPQPVRFWAAPPSKGPGTVLVWQFNAQGALDGDALEAELLGDLTADPGDQLLTGKADEIGYDLQGGAKQVADGRFGGGVFVSQSAKIQSKSVDLPGLLRTDKAFTLEFWIKPKALENAVLLELLTRRDKPSLQLQMADTGILTLAQGQAPTIRHRRPIDAGRWHHVAVGVDGADRQLVLTVNGHAQGTTAAQAPEVFRLLAALSNRFVLGSKFTGGIDAVRLSRRSLEFYSLGDPSLLDPDGNRPLISGPPYFASANKETLYCSFDQTLMPEHTAGLTPSARAGHEAFVPGVRGQALDLSKDKAFSALYPGMGILPAQGTLEFWFRPKTWDNFFVGDFRGTNVPSTVLFRIASKNRMAHYMGFRKLRLRWGRAASESGKDLYPLHPGKWTHVVVTWGRGGQRTWLDGKPQTVNQVLWQGAGHVFDRQDYDKWKERTGGKQDGTYRFVFSPSPTYIDELRIYPWTMNPAEVQNAYRRYWPDAKETLKPLPLIEGVFEYFAHDWENVDKLKAAVTCLPVQGTKPEQVDVQLLDADGRQIDQQLAVELNKAGSATVTFRHHLPFGVYTLHTISKAGDKALETVDLEYKRVRPPWFENQLGKERRVPKPWTPMVVKDRIIQVWGRDIELAESGLPKRITAQDRPVLAAPVELQASIGDATVPLAPGKLDFTETAADRVAWKTANTLGPLKAEINAWMEYDGLMYFTVTLMPDGDQPVTLDQLHVRFPMTQAETTQLIANGAGGNFRRSYDVRMLPREGAGSIWNSRTSKPKMQRGLKPGSFLPHIWVGGDHVGLSFSGDNDRGWTISKTVPAQEVRREGDQVVFQMNVICEPTQIAENHQFHFIVLPTPTKPTHPLWRGWNRLEQGTPAAAYDCIDDFIGFPLKSAPDNSQSLKFHLEPHSWEAAQIQKEKIHAKFGAENPVIFYMDYSWPRPGEHFKDWNHDLWAGTGRIAWTIPELEDYMVWIINEYIKRDLIDGIYVDDVSCGRTWSLAGTAYPWDGNEQKRRQGFTSMGFRRFCQRIWKLFEARGKDPHIQTHMTLCFEIPALSFCMAAVNGEARMIGLGAKRDTMDHWRRHELRIMGNGSKWGFATFWKPTVEVQGQIPSALKPWHYQQCRTLQAHVVQHDMWFFWTYPTTRVIQGALVEFGMDDPTMTFLPYWENQDVIKLTPVPAPRPRKGAKPDNAKQTEPPTEPVLAGIFRKPGKALVLISNYAHVDQDVSVEIDIEKLFGKPGAVVWRDADISLEPPKPTAANAAEIKQAETDMLKGGTGLDGDIDFDLDDAENLLDDTDPREEAMKRLEATFKTNTAKLIVRRRDYRLLEVKLK